jgi:myo-inositol-1(or 4)-monophosphatase
MSGTTQARKRKRGPSMNISDDYLRVCERAVRAGAATIQAWAGRAEVREKGPADLVTQADLQSQEVVRRTVLDAFPDHQFMGEEGSAGPNPDRSGCPRWIVDPLDGTTNFVHGVPHYSVSLALEQNGSLLVGAVYDPNRDECFTAASGGGARLNGRPIRVSQVTDPSQAIGAVGFPPSATADGPDVRMFLAAVGRFQSIRRTGSAALNLCYVAAGRFDAYWSFSTHVWDVAAGVLIVREAGGVVSAVDGGPFRLEDPRFLAAANGTLLARLQALVPATV